MPVQLVVEQPSSKTVEDNEVTIQNPDDIISDLGGCGRFQIRIALIVHVIKTITNWSMISMVFLTAVPDWQCKDDINITKPNNISLEKSCVNVDGNKCTSFEFFDKEMRTIVSEWGLVCDQEWIPSTIITIQLVVEIVGYILAGHLADAFGRRYPFYSSILLTMLFSLISYFSVNWIMFTVTRIMIGIGSAFFLTIQFSYLSEFTLARWRSWFIGFPSWPIQGCFLALVLWLVKDWRNMQLVIASIGVPFMATIWFMPESFRWYYGHDRAGDAEKVLTTVAKINRRPVPDMTYMKQLAIQHLHENKKDKKYSALDLFRSRFLIKVTLLLSLTWTAIGISNIGITFAIPQLPGNFYFNMFLIHAVQIPSKAIGIWLQNRFGRRNTSILVYVINGVFSLLVGIVQYIDTDDRDNLTIGFAVVANLAMATTWGPLQTITIEVYPTVIRNIGFSYCAILANASGAIAPTIVHLDEYIPGIIYFVMGGLCLVGACALVWIPETKEENLSDRLDETMNHRKD